MVLLLALAAVSGVVDVPLPPGGMCPDGFASGQSVTFCYGDGNDGWVLGDGHEKPVRINSIGGTVVAGGERGPKIVPSGESICAVWQGDYKQGAHVWFARGTADGLDPQRDLLDGKTPGIDHPAIASSGPRVVVLWLDGRGGQDKQAPVTSTIWYSLSTDGGKTFGPNRTTGIRACACCSFSPSFDSDGSLTITYRGGNENVRDIWRAAGDLAKGDWTLKRLTSTGWTYEGCPMDGPRRVGSHLAYTIDGRCNADGALLGDGKYASVSRWGIAIWQTGDTIHWRDLHREDSATVTGAHGRAIAIGRPDGTTVIVH